MATKPSHPSQSNTPIQPQPVSEKGRKLPCKITWFLLILFFILWGAAITILGIVFIVKGSDGVNCGDYGEPSCGPASVYASKGVGLVCGGALIVSIVLAVTCCAMGRSRMHSSSVDEEDRVYSIVLQTRVDDYGPDGQCRESRTMNQTFVNEDYLQQPPLPPPPYKATV